MRESKVNTQPGTSSCSVSLSGFEPLPLCGRAEALDLHLEASHLPGCDAAAGLTRELLSL